MKVYFAVTLLAVLGFAACSSDSDVALEQPIAHEPERIADTKTFKMSATPALDQIIGDDGAYRWAWTGGQETDWELTIEWLRTPSENCSVQGQPSYLDLWNSINVFLRDPKGVEAEILTNETFAGNWNWSFSPANATEETMRSWTTKADFGTHPWGDQSWQILVRRDAYNSPVDSNCSYEGEERLIYIYFK